MAWWDKNKLSGYDSDIMCIWDLGKGWNKKGECYTEYKRSHMLY